MRFNAVFAVIIMAVLLVGCAESPAQKIIRSPILIMDFIYSQGLTKVYVHSIADIRYSRITITVDNTTITEEMVIAMNVNTSLDEFNLSVEVVDKERVFGGNFRVHVLPDPETALRITDMKGKVYEVGQEDLPWKHRLDEV